MSDRYVIGVDPGINGGVAMVGPGPFDLAGWLFMPKMDRVGGAGRVRIVDARTASDKLSELIALISDRQASIVGVVERVHAMPRQGVSSAFNFGHNAGMIEAALRIHVDAVSSVPPSVWKKEMGLSADKGQSVAMARDRFGPHSCFQYKTKDGVAEAALIAAYWWRKYSS